MSERSNDRREFQLIHLKFVNALAFYTMTGFFAIVGLTISGLVDLEKPNVSVVVGMIIGHTATLASIVVNAYFHAKASAKTSYEGVERRAGPERRLEDDGPPDPPGIERRTGVDRRKQPGE